MRNYGYSHSSGLNLLLSSSKKRYIENNIGEIMYIVGFEQHHF